MSDRDEALHEESQRHFRINSTRVAEIVAIEGKAAYDRAMAWAQSVKGTPYGSTTPTLSKETNR